MSNLNSCFFTGKLGSDIDLRFMPSGVPVCNVSLACNRRHKTKDDEWRETTVWVGLTFIGKNAENISRHAGKGSFIRVTTEYRIRDYTDRNNNAKKSHEFIVSEFEYLSYDDVNKHKELNADKPEAEQPESNENRSARSMAGNEDLDEGVPF